MTSAYLDHIAPEGRPRCRRSSRIVGGDVHERARSAVTRGERSPTSPFIKYRDSNAIDLREYAQVTNGGEGVADTELSYLMGMARALRIADGPYEVHRGMVARLELAKYR